MHPTPSLRSYQTEPVDWLTKQERGLLVAPAGSGKTRMALTALSRIRNPDSRFLWLAHTREQVAQAQAAQKDVCPDLNIEFACYAGIWNATYLRVRYTHVICDEAHHLAKTSWGKMVKEADLKFLWLLTATPFSGDAEGDKFLRSLFTESHVLDVDKVREAGGLVETEVLWLGPLEHDLILQKEVDREVEYRTEKMVRWNKRISHATAKQRSIWLVNHNIGIVENKHRNRIVVDSAKEVLDEHPGASVLVLINHVAHAQKLILMDGGISEDCLVQGKTPLKQRREKLKEFVDGKRSLLLGTASLFGEGFDAPGMTHVINAAGGKSPIAIVQRAGRSSRTSTNKSCGHVIDFSDKHLRTLSNHATERQEIYSSLGYRHA